LTPRLRRLAVPRTHRLVASRYPPAGIFDAICTPGDLAAIADLEGWTNDRLQAELGQLHLVPKSEWVVGVPNASVVMAAFCHPSKDGARFTSAELGPWRPPNMARIVELNRGPFLPAPAELRPVDRSEDLTVVDVRPAASFPRLHHPTSYRDSRRFGIRLRTAGSNGIVYESVRDPGHDCLVAFRPKLVRNVRQGGHFEYRWDGAQEPVIRQLVARRSSRG